MSNYSPQHQDNSHAHLPYPVKRTTYNKIVGQIRVDNITAILKREGYSVKSVAVENSDVDIWVYDQTGNLLLVIEVTNWRFSSYACVKKNNSVRDNFQKYKCLKLLIISFAENFAGDRDLGDDLDVLVIGFQTQPFYDFYKVYEEGLYVDEMRPDNEDTYRIVRDLILSYLTSKLKKKQTSFLPSFSK